MTVDEFDGEIRVLLVAQILQIFLVPDSVESILLDSYVDLGPMSPEVLTLATTLLGRLMTEKECGVLKLKLFAFLRKVYILRSTLFDVFFSELPDGSGGAPLLEIFNSVLPSFQQMPMDEIEHYRSIWKGQLSQDGLLKSIRECEAFASFRFVPLPETYVFSYEKKYTSFTCPHCSAVPSETFMCLICETLLPQCKTRNCRVRGLGECNRVSSKPSYPNHESLTVSSTWASAEAWEYSS